MAKEPAGLRRWRLAHRKHKRTRRFVVAKRKRRYSRRGRKGKGRRMGRQAIPLIQTAILTYPVIQAYNEVGLTKILPAQICLRLTGFNPTASDPFANFDKSRAIAIGGGLLVATLIGGKIASRTGANRLMKKLSMGYLKVA